MRRSMLTLGVAPPAPAPVFGARTTGGVTAATSVSVTMPTITGPGLVVVGVGGSRGSATPTFSMTGFTSIAETFTTSGATGGFVAIFAKVTAGSESAQNFSVGSGNTNMTYVAEYWSGIDTLPTVVGLGGFSSSTSPSLNSNTVNVTVPNSIVYTVVGGRGASTGVISPSWGGGAVAAYNTASGRIGFNANATQTVLAPASVTHTVSITNTQSPPISCVNSIVLEPA